MSHDNDIPDDPIGSDLVREDPSFTELVLEFVDGLSDKVREMESALRATDFEALQASAHQLKGSGGGCGYPLITERATQLEQHAKEAAEAECRNAFAELKEICSRIVVSTDD